MPQGTKVLSVMDGTVKDISDGSITLENEKGYKVKITNCSNIRVSEGAEVKEGDVIAKVNSQGSVRISFTYHRTNFNPYFYLDVGEGSVYGAGGNVSAKAGALITEAETDEGESYQSDLPLGDRYCKDISNADRFNKRTNCRSDSRFGSRKADFGKR